MNALDSFREMWIWNVSIFCVKIIWFSLCFALFIRIEALFARVYILRFHDWYHEVFNFFLFNLPGNIINFIVHVITIME